MLNIPANTQQYLPNLLLAGSTDEFINGYNPARGIYSL